jgi:hypothetical protein
MIEGKDVKHPHAWMHGYRDCQAGKAHGAVEGYTEEQQSEYDRGYGSCYELEQVMEYLTR